MKPLPTVLAGLLLTASISAPAAAAEPMRVVDRIVAIVDHHPILQSELFEHARPALTTARASGTLDAQSPTILRQALEELVDQVVFRSEAARLEVVVADDEVDRAVAVMMQKSNIKDERALWVEVERLGYDRTSYRDELRRQILEAKVVFREVAKEKERLGDAELAARRAAYRAKKPGATDDDARVAVDDELFTSVRARVLDELRGQHFIELRP